MVSCPRQLRTQDGGCRLSSSKATMACNHLTSVLLFIIFFPVITQIASRYLSNSLSASSWCLRSLSHSQILMILQVRALSLIISCRLEHRTSLSDIQMVQSISQRSANPVSGDVSATSPVTPHPLLKHQIFTNVPTVPF